MTSISKVLRVYDIRNFATKRLFQDRGNLAGQVKAAHYWSASVADVVLNKMLRLWSSVYVFSYSRSSGSDGFAGNGPTDQNAFSNSLPVLSQYDMTKYKAPQGVVVLCHGLFGFDKMGPSNVPWLQLHYWRNIPDALAAIGCKVHVARVGRVDSLAQRAQQLFDQLNELFPGEQVHLIAHSMGGLDCRYMLSHVAQKQPTKFIPKTLTTICTPHRGSPMMDWFRDQFGIGHHEKLKRLEDLDKVDASSSTFSLQSFVKTIVSVLDAPAFANLTTDYCIKVLNPATPDHPDVRYFSYGAARDLPFYHTLHIPQQIIKRLEGENDGLVSVQSAKWGTYLGTVACDHWDLNNKWRPKEVIAPVLEAIPSITNTIASVPSKVSSSLSEQAAVKEPISSSSSPPFHPSKPGAVQAKPASFDCIEFYLRHVTFLQQQEQPK